VRSRLPLNLGVVWMAFFYCNGQLFLDLKTNKFHVRAVRPQR